MAQIKTAQGRAHNVTNSTQHTILTILAKFNFEAHLDCASHLHPHANWGAQEDAVLSHPALDADLVPLISRRRNPGLARATSIQLTLNVLNLHHEAWRDAINYYSNGTTVTLTISRYSERISEG